MTTPSFQSRRALAWVLAHPDGGRESRRQAGAWLAGEASDPGRTAAAEAAVPLADRVLLQLDRLGWRWCDASEPGFPPGLVALADPPLGLFVRGTLPAGPAVALVGARKASAYGREVAECFGRELARAGVTVVSGMARGVDAAAHRGAIASSGPTAAVWGSGPDRLYPPEHDQLAAQIVAHGALLTEYPPGSPPLAHHFPERNRLIAGLAQAIVVVEADVRSGALITARLALEEGRDVLAVPGSVFAPLSAGPNGLLRSGAAPALTVADILEVIGVVPPPATPEPPADGLLAALKPGTSATVDDLASATGMPVAAVLESLVQLELEGRVVREPDGSFRRGHRSATG
ncbi:MAG TPA: DNA-processing protein DprA [Thermoanaerobaculaceae bacterium]|nr:DNA-processing protein DprA [Thermoanaerobaculaceae bacterium]HPS77619.1 DNA-processing protein DprA [Thermoanaerobaculaceae bacterium]